LLTVWILANITLALYECEIVNPRSGCFIPSKVSFDACAKLFLLVRRSFLKDGGKNDSLFCWVSIPVCAASKLVPVLTVGYCVRHKNQHSTYCAVLSQFIAVEVQ